MSTVFCQRLFWDSWLLHPFQSRPTFAVPTTSHLYFITVFTVLHENDQIKLNNDVERNYTVKNLT